MYMSCVIIHIVITVFLDWFNGLFIWIDILLVAINALFIAAVINRSAVQLKFGVIF